MTTVPMACAVCGRRVPSFWDLGRLRICRQCERVVCGWHGKRVGPGVYECVECRDAANR